MTCGDFWGHMFQDKMAKKNKSVLSEGEIKGIVDKLVGMTDMDPMKVRKLAEDIFSSGRKKEISGLFVDEIPEGNQRVREIIVDSLEKVLGSKIDFKRILPTGLQLRVGEEVETRLPSSLWNRNPFLDREIPEGSKGTVSSTDTYFGRVYVTIGNKEYRLLPKELAPVLNVPIKKAKKQNRRILKKARRESLENFLEGIASHVEDFLVTYEDAEEDINPEGNDVLRALRYRFPNTNNNQDLAKALVEETFSESRRGVVSEYSEYAFDRVLLPLLEGAGLVQDEKRNYSPDVGALKKIINSFFDKKNVEVSEFLRKHSLVIPGEGTAYTYIPGGGGNLDPYSIGEEFLIDLVEGFGEWVSDGNSTNRSEALLEAARQLVVDKRTFNGREIGQLKKGLTKPDIVYLGQVREAFGDANLGEDGSTRQFKTFGLENMVHNSENLHAAQVAALKGGGLYLLERDLVVGAMIGALSGGTKKGTGGRGDDFRIFWERYKPHEFDLKVHSQMGNPLSRYKLVFTNDLDLIDAARVASNTCLNRGEITQFVGDDGTYNLVTVNENDDPVGYARFFLCEARKGNPVLALDTMEVRVDPQDDWRKMIGLASIQLGLDLGVESVVGTTCRVAYGPRQGFGNYYTGENFSVKKIGANSGMKSYNFSFPNGGNAPGTYNKKATIVMKNWRFNNG
jgi:hypothetical protein